MSGNNKLVVVTGASGYVAGPLIDLLLQKGYRVRGTVRSLSDKSKIQHLQQDFPNLELYEADLLKPGSFHDAFQGVECVFHTASPFQTSVNDPQKDLVDPALNGTINVLEEALKVVSIKKIVLTSSVATVRRPDKEEGYISSEKDWNNFANIQNLPYPYSKVQAEKKAWEIITQHNSSHPDHQVKLITVLPSWVIGPPVGSRIDGVSVGVVASWLDESQVEKGVRCQLVPCVDVRDVAKGHVAAMEIDSANGRYLLSQPKTTNPLDMIKVLEKLYPHKKFPHHLAEPGKLNPDFGVDNTRAINELGIDFISVETSLKDMAEKLISLGVVKA